LQNNFLATGKLDVKESERIPGWTNLGSVITLLSVPICEGDFYEEMGRDRLQLAWGGQIF